MSILGIFSGCHGNGSQELIKNSKRNQHFSDKINIIISFFSNFTVVRVFKLKQTKIPIWPYALVLP